MIVECFLYDQYKKEMESCGPQVKTALAKECANLVLWGERHSMGVVDPGRSIVAVKKVYDRGDGKNEEFEVDEEGWHLERCQENLSLVRELDVVIAGMFKTLKGAGVSKPSCQVYYQYQELIHSQGYDHRWSEKGGLKRWCAVTLVLQRLRSTARIAARYGHFELFGPLKKYENGRVVQITYDRSPWAKELRRRGLLGSRGGRG